jgi:UPF0716 protein FxsA
MAFLAVLILVVPIVELYLFVQVSNAIGFWNALGILIVISLVGVWLVKRAGTRVWARFSEQIVAGTTPTKEVADGVCLLVAGALLVFPGYFTDALGLLLLLPPVRALARHLVIKRYTGRGQMRVIRASYRRSGGDIIDMTDVGHAGTTRPDPTSRGDRAELERP